MKTYGKWSCGSTILDLGTKWRWVVSFTPRPLYSLGKSPRYPLDKRLGGPQNLCECCGEEKNCAPAGIRTPAVQPVASPTELSRLRVILLIQHFNANTDSSLKYVRISIVLFHCCFNKVYLIYMPFEKMTPILVISRWVSLHLHMYTGVEQYCHLVTWHPVIVWTLGGLSVTIHKAVHRIFCLACVCDITGKRN
jgi:hypothetical protein